MIVYYKKIQYKIAIYWKTLSPSLTAPLYVAENSQEQIANLDGAIFKLCPTHSGLLTLPPLLFLLRT